MELRPIFSALMRNKAGLFLIVAQVAITLAVICNSLFIVVERAERVGRPSGMDETNTFTVDSLGFAPGYDLRDAVAADLALLRAMPGVRNAVTTNTVPTSNGGWSTGLALTPDDGTDSREGFSTALYFADEQAIDTFGLTLVEGRNFRPDEIGELSQATGVTVDVVIVTEALARALFPDGNAVGQQVYGLGNDNRTVTIIGVIDHLQQPWVGSQSIDQSALVPTISVDGAFSRYLVRTEPGERDRVMAQVEAALQASNGGRLVRRVRAVEDVRAASYRQDRAMMSILSGTMLAMVLVTGLGIVGLTSFWVTRRIKQIGTRRALGARRLNIRVWFQTENGLMIGLGIVLGAALTYGFNAWLMQAINAQRLPWYYLPAGALVVFVLGQLAVLGPAGRAAAVPPALATRTA
ncbi:MAG: ABC transporter permease [Xanthomonadales bacterium]|nr:ABC transporter permease [Xanthomonadales bacterium]